MHFFCNTQILLTIGAFIISPLLLSADAEGAGELFQVTNLKNISSSDANYENDFFGKKTNLTVSGQLEAELVALGLGKVYTFGPTFRAEKLKHLKTFSRVLDDRA